tara:strand:+ start:374 stop:997 length:624 start_codon:yes stop_codon:yes gene_type:complete
MKIKKARLREIVHGVISEAAKEGHIQKIYRRSFADMINKASSGGNKNTPPFTKKAPKPGKSGPVTEQNTLTKSQVKYSGILKLSLDTMVKSEAEALQIFLPQEAVRLSPDSFHLTLLHQGILKPFAAQLKDMDYPSPPPIILDDVVFKRTSPGKKSWAVRVVNQNEMREYVKHIMDLLGSQNTNPEPERVFHVSLANLTGEPKDSVK